MVMSMGVTVVMLMLAMFIMMMMAVVIVVVVVVVVVTMRRVVLARMIVCAVIMRLMIVAMFRTVAMAIGIGATFGVERRFDLDYTCTQPLYHRLDDVITPDPQSLADDLGRQMAVAEMPGDPNQMIWVGAADLDQQFRRRDHFDQPVIVEHQCIATAQRNGVFEIKQEFQPPRARHRHPPPVTIVEIKHDGIGGRLSPAMLRADLRGSDHRLRISRPWRR